MSSAVSLIQTVLQYMLDLVLGPLSGFPPEIGLTVISIIVGAVFLFVYGRISFQSAIAKTKKAIHASFLESILFRHSVRQSLNAQRNMLLGGLKYLLLAIPPFLIMALPCIFLLAELQTRYGYRSLAVGESLLVRAHSADSKLINKIALTADDKISVTGPLRIPKDSEVFWRLVPNERGEYQAKLTVNGNLAAAHPLFIENNFSRVTPHLYSNGWSRLLYPSNFNPEKSIINELEFFYPGRKLDFFGFKLQWIFPFLIVSILTGVVFSRIFKVQI